MAQYEGVITLQNVNDGAAGRGVSSIETKYYLGDNSTEHPSDTSSDWQDSLPTLEQGKYLWTQTKVSYTSGNPVYNYSISYVATDGTITTQYYTRIKYAEDNQGTNWSDTPTSTTTYVGFYSGVEQSPAASQYTWSRYVGEKGDKGDTGNNGQSSYTYIRYSEQSDGTGFVSTPTASTKYIGVYSGTSATAPTNKAAYTWSKYIGDNGKDGNGITSITYYYKTTTTNSAPEPSQITSTTMPTLSSTDKYLWQKEVIDFTDSTVADKVTVTLLAVYGDTGQAGTSITITNTEIMYVGSTSGTETPSSGWQNTVPSIANGNYLWTRTVVTYSDGSSTTAYSVAYKGTNGENGANGTNYATVYLYRRFASTPSSSDKPNGNVIYTFESGTVSGSLNSWQRAVPSGTNPCYMILAQATASAGTTTDTIAKTEWSDPVEVFKNGTDGAPGQNGAPGSDGYNQATIYLYKRIASGGGTTGPTSAITYTFSNGSITTTGLNGWTREIPQVNGNPCYVISAVAISQDSSVSIATNKWSTAVKMVEDGVDGEDGNKYYIKSNIDTIKRLFDVDGNDIVYMPVQFEFQVFDNSDSSTPLQTSSYSYTATLISSDTLVTIDVTNKCTTAPQTNPNMVVLSIEKLQELGESISLATEDYKIRFEVLYDGKTVAQQMVSIENGLETDFARFKINATNISANIAQAGLVFSSEGLTINNGNFTIKNANNEELFKYDKTSQSLSVIGNGTFTGNIYANDGEFTGIVHATDGDFTGQITATSGNIGGFIIQEGRLVSSDGQSIELNGASGSIIANNITLGTGAIIDDYLKLGSAYIYNPDKHGNLLISAGSDIINSGYIKIYDTGIMDLGTIEINGESSVIQLDDPNAKIIAGSNVTITSDRSIFNNVDVTGTIHTSVFEVGKVQTAGGAMIFKEGAEIDTITPSGNNYIFTTKTPINLDVNSIIIFTNKDTNATIYGQISAVSSNMYTTTTNITGYTNIIQLADYQNNSYTNNLVIGINSGSSLEKMLYPQALTMREVKEYSNNIPVYAEKPTLVLGNLNDIISSNSNIKGYGLYGENVYLTGSLTTETSTTSYAGVNTLNGVTANIFDSITNLTSDNSKIVFWAGANESQYSTLDAAIQNAPFQVTEQGSFYAGQGYFRGAIITDADIYAAALHTADIYGTGTITSERKDVLKIHDTNSGIGFYNENDERQLNITNSGLGWGDNNQFIQIANNLINFNGNNFSGTLFAGAFEGNLTTDKVDNKYVNLEGPTIEGRQGTNEAYTALSKLVLNNNPILTNNTESIQLNLGIINITADITSMSGDVYFGDKMKYQKVFVDSELKGYDLYIS